MYGITQAAGMLASGLNQRALVIGADVLSKLMNFADRSTCVLFGDGAGAVVLEPVAEQGFLGFELGADGAGGVDLSMPAGGSRMPATAETVANDLHYVQMNGRHVYKFATRVLVSSAEALLDEDGEWRSRTWTFTFPTRPTSGSSIMPWRDWGSRRNASS